MYNSCVHASLRLRFAVVRAKWWAKGMKIRLFQDFETLKSSVECAGAMFKLDFDGVTEQFQDLENETAQLVY